MNFFQEYLKEAENKELIKTDKGFVVYRLDKDSVYIDNMWVAPMYRKQEGFKELLCELFDNIGTNEIDIYANVDEEHPRAEITLSYYFYIGCHIHKMKEGTVVLKADKRKVSSTINKFIKELRR